MTKELQKDFSAKNVMMPKFHRAGGQKSVPGPRHPHVWPRLLLPTWLGELCPLMATAWSWQNTLAAPCPRPHSTMRDSYQKRVIKSH